MKLPISYILRQHRRTITLLSLSFQHKINRNFKILYYFSVVSFTFRIATLTSNQIVPHLSNTAYPMPSLNMSAIKEKAFFLLSPRVKKQKEHLKNIANLPHDNLKLS